MLSTMMIITATVFFFAGMVFGWRRASRGLYRRPGSKWDSDTVSPRRLSSRVLARRRWRRIVASLQFGVVAALLGAAIFQLLMVFAGR